jgi:hypothetical protein
MAEFDAYLMVDWSASSRPVTGKDSVWYCLVIRNGDNVSVAARENPPTRRQAVTEINDILRGIARPGQMVLVGFDFPYGYPAGFADALGLTDARAWIGVWREIARRIVDGDDNGNNRFEVAGDLNRSLSSSRYRLPPRGANRPRCLAPLAVRGDWRKNVSRISGICSRSGSCTGIARSAVKPSLVSHLTALRNDGGTGAGLSRLAV